MIKPDNIYYQSRMRAAKMDQVYASRERAGYAVGVSVEALSDYEAGITLPGCEVVGLMADAYGDPGLKARHIRAACPLMGDYGTGGCPELTQAALKCMLELGGDKAQGIALRFAQLAQDGRIDVGERPAAAEIRQRAIELRQTMEDVISAIDKACVTRGSGG